MKKSLIGLILVSFGLGMLAAKLVPWWGIIAAVAMIIGGIFLIIKKC